MAKLEINSIFYSKQNVNLAYDLKTACRELGISVINANDVPELVRFLNEIAMGIVFFDCTTLKLNESIVSFIRSNVNSKNTIIVCIVASHHAGLEGVDYVVHARSLLEDLKQIHNELIAKTNKQNANHAFNTSEVNTFLTKYLISIGVAPKHVGFTYIKQAIQIALKHGTIGSLSKEVYPTVACMNKTLSQNVERNIRNAIECACKSEEMQRDNIRQLLTQNKISNRAFLSYLLDMVLNNFSKVQMI